MTRYFVFRTVLMFSVLAISAASQTVALEGIDTGLGGNNSISGTILGPSGQRMLRRIQVKLITMSRGTRTSMSDDAGNFIFRGVPAGNYTVAIEKEADLEPFNQNVEIIQFRGAPGQNYYYSIKLRSKPSTDAKPGVINADLVTIPKEALAHFAKAQELSRAGNLKGSVEELKLAIARHPQFMLAYNEMGVQYLKLNELDSAEAALVKALEIEPDAYPPTMNRGIVLFTGKKFAESEPLLRKAVLMRQDEPVPHYFLGQALANMGKFDEAEKELTTATLSRRPEMKEAFRILAIIYGSRGDKKRAAASLEEYLKLAPNASDADALRMAIKQFKGEATPTAVPAASPKPL